MAFVVTQKLTSIEQFGLILKSTPDATCYDPGSIPVFVISAAILTVTEICTLLIFIKLILKQHTLIHNITSQITTVVFM